MSEDRICVGVIAGAFGVHGEVRIKSFCAVPEDISLYNPLWSEDGKRQFLVAIDRSIKNGFAARIEGVTSKEMGDALSNVKLFADRESLPSLPDDEFYYTDLVGLTVFDAGGKELGKVSAVHNHGASDVLEVKVPGQSAPALLPFTRDAVPTIDLASGRIIADPPEGVFPA